MDNQTMIIGHTPEIRGVLRLIEVFSASSATVLVTGESGSGKELVAQALHRKSPRAKGPFVPVNCAAIPRDLLESELFGYRKGAFSGAVTDRMGRFELANGGTIFLDEIGDMSLDMQSKMLRVLQEGVVDPIGSSRQVRVDVRVIAATHRDLEADCETGRFREDLFYRLNVLPIAVPALRERREDIPDLVAHFAQRHAVAGSPAVGFDAEFLALLKEYSWPGNIRELSNVVHRLGVMCPGKQLSWWTVPAQMLPKKLREMLPAEQPREPEPVPEVCVSSARAVFEPGLPPPSANFNANPSPNANANASPNPIDEIIMIAQGRRDFPDEGVFLKAHLADVEKKIISRALDHAGGNISRTAQLLNLQRTTLIQKLNKLKGGGAEGDRFESMSSSMAA